MSELFTHTDPEGDYLKVAHRSPGDLGTLYFDTSHIGSYLDRDAVLRLHAALGEWLYPVHTPEWANKSLIEQMIERAVRDQVAAVLPLHLKPGNRPLMADADGRVRAANNPEPLLFRCRRCGASPGGAHENCAGDERACTYIRPGDAGYDLLADPEPHDVGHAEEPDHGRLMAELPRRTRPRPICVSCGHGWGEHTGGICWGDSESDCSCTRERPGTAPASCTCPVGPRIRSYPHSHIVGCPRSSSGTS